MLLHFTSSWVGFSLTSKDRARIPEYRKRLGLPECVLKLLARVPGFQFPMISRPVAPSGNVANAHQSVVCGSQDSLVVGLYDFFCLERIVSCDRDEINSKEQCFITPYCFFRTLNVDRLFYEGL